MNWLELSIKAPSEYVEPLSVIFDRYGYGGVAIEQLGGPNPDEFDGEWEYLDAILRSYIPIDNKTESVKEHIRVAVALISQLCKLPPLEERYIKEGEWMESWRKHFSILTIGRIVICPSWKDYTPRDTDIVISLDPGMAFGTGYHPTTNMCLSALDGMLKPGDKVLDLGTGSGILSIASAKLGAEHVIGVDIDELVMKTAIENVKINGVQNSIDIKDSTIMQNTELHGQFDLVVANIYPKVIIDLAKDMKHMLRKKGILILSGITIDKEKDVMDHLKQLDFFQEKVAYQGDWVSISAVKS